MFKYGHRLPRSLINLPIVIKRGKFNKISVSSQGNVNAAAHVVLTKNECVFVFLPCLHSLQETPFLYYFLQYLLGLLFMTLLP